MITSGLNPLIINHTANTISCTAIGRANTVKIDEIILGSSLYIPTKPYNKTNAAPISPQVDNHLGMSLD